LDLKEYIASGILESYVLGEVSPQEKQEVECLSSIYPELKEALVELQVSIENVADQNRIEPPADLKEKVLSNLFKEIDNDLEEKVIKHDFTGERQDKVEENSKNNTWKLMAAAFFALFLIATTIFINTRSDNQVLAEQVEDLESEVSNKEKQVDQVSEEYTAMLDSKNNLLAFLSDTNTRRVALKGTDLSASSLVNVYWNEATEKVVLHVDNLPTTPTKKQYQLWAIVDGKPKDMGVLPKDDMSAQFIDMTKTTGKAAAFAITLEEEGGKPEPNLDQLYVIGNV
tara:strand:+ start:157271 stop:158122 length:852 start_codon:yes stop_codon:yes gene_type:complete